MIDFGFQLHPLPLLLLAPRRSVSASMLHSPVTQSPRQALAHWRCILLGLWPNIVAGADNALMWNKAAAKMASNAFFAISAWRKRQQVKKARGIGNKAAGVQGVLLSGYCMYTLHLRRVLMVYCSVRKHIALQCGARIAS